MMTGKLRKYDKNGMRHVISLRFKKETRTLKNIIKLDFFTVGAPSGALSNWIIQQLHETCVPDKIARSDFKQRSWPEWRGHDCMDSGGRKQRRSCCRGVRSNAHLQNQIIFSTH